MAGEGNKTSCTEISIAASVALKSYCYRYSQLKMWLRALREYAISIPASRISKNRIYYQRGDRVYGFLFIFTGYPVITEVLFAKLANVHKF